MSHQFPVRAFLAVLIGTAGMAAGCGGATSAPTAPTGSSALQVISVSPNTGSIDGQTALRILGTGFKSGATVTLDGMKVDATLVTASALNAVAPPHAAGPIDVVVTNADGQNSRLAGGFTYVAKLTGLVISGKTALASVGETSQLTVTASYADGTTRDVTNETRWFVSNPAVAAMSTGGVLAATGLGATTILAQYPVSTAPSVFQSFLASVTPLGTFVLSGRVREPGAGDLGGVLVRNAASGQSMFTVTGNGQFSLAGLTNGHLSFTKDAYESVEFDVAPGVQADVPMQRVVRLPVGSAPISSRLAPNDLDYLVAAGTHCQPCRLIRITGPASGAAQMRLTWTDTTAPLTVWVNGRAFVNDAGLPEVIADVPLGSGEAVIFVGKASAGVPDKYLPFTLAVTAAGGQTLGSR